MGLRCPMATASIELALWKPPPHAHAAGYVCTTLRAVIGVTISLAPGCPECGRDREFTLWPRMTGRAAQLPLSLLAASLQLVVRRVGSGNNSRLARPERWRCPSG